MQAIGNYVKGMDLYGNPVGLTYNGKAKHSTFAGGIATVLTVSLALYWWVMTFLNHRKWETRRFTY
jgi:hypothetical protein